MEEQREGEAFFSNLAKHDFGPQRLLGPACCLTCVLFEKFPSHLSQGD